jgi:hypothetical protein
MAGELFFPPNLHLLTLNRKWTYTYLHLTENMSRCRFGAKLCHGGNVFCFMKLEELMVGEDPEQEKFRIGGNTFYDWKNKILMKIPNSKRSKIGIITEFRRIPNKFPNLGNWY